MSTQHDDGWRLSDAMWARMAPLIPPPKPHPLGCHRPRIPDRVRSVVNGRVQRLKRLSVFHNVFV